MGNLIFRVNGQIFLGFGDFVAKRGADMSELLQSIGIDDRSLSETSTEISIAAAGRVLEEAAVRTGASTLGWDWGLAVPAGVTGVVGYMIRHAPTVLDAATTMARYLPLIARPNGVSFSETPDRIVLSWAFPEGEAHPGPQFASLLLALCISRLRWKAGADWMPAAVEIDSPQPMSPTTGPLGPDVRYGCRRNAVHIDRRELSKSAVDVDTGLFLVLRELADRMLREPTVPSDVLTDARHAIMLQIDGGNVSLERTAAAIRILPGELRRTLREAGSSFANLVDEARRTAAERYLLQTTLSLTEIAFLVGFSELSAFTRAANRWFDMAPTEYRRAHRRAAAPTAKPEKGR